MQNCLHTVLKSVEGNNSIYQYKIDNNHIPNNNNRAINKYQKYTKKSLKFQNKNKKKKKDININNKQEQQITTTTQQQQLQQLVKQPTIYLLDQQVR